MELDELESHKSTELSYDSDENRATHLSEVNNQSRNALGISRSSYKSAPASQSTLSNGSTNSQCHATSGIYDAEKCRAYIASQIKVSKIDRFAAQVGNAIETEAEIQSRLGNLMNLFRKRAAQAAHDFTFRCKLGLARHRQDRILNQKRKGSASDTSGKSIGRRVTRSAFYPDKSRLAGLQVPRANTLNPISEDLLHGVGIQLFRNLLVESGSIRLSKSPAKKAREEELLARLVSASSDDSPSVANLTGDDCQLSELFEPQLFVCRLEDRLMAVMEHSRRIGSQLNNVRQLFERLAMEHRDQVDAVYALEEERQAAAGVVRRSTYNLSMAAFKAASTPVHVSISQASTTSPNVAI